ncbi:unnamed protein product [Protopolystoma xenopodis]|uniref:UDENN domain-containing protein n=1 Tax=Protopolystoma xenopodis TaxID=117903 RepID=A0A448WUG7_9PLAT|nr:unnamed protein product [Protopolystoma xenopodis]
MTADHIYPPLPPAKPPELAFQDKQLRAVFLRLFTSLFAGYRSCLTITRIHPKPVIHFNKALFLLLRGIWHQNEFFDRLLSSMRFYQFTQERGPPFRVCDIFDEEYDTARSGGPLYSDLTSQFSTVTATVTNGITTQQNQPNQHYQSHLQVSISTAPQQNHSFLPSNQNQLQTHELSNQV